MSRQKDELWSHASLVKADTQRPIHARQFLLPGALPATVNTISFSPLQESWR